MLKELQGHIWEEGFLSGEIRGLIYEDAYKRLKEWKKNGYKLYIFSSSFLNHKLLLFLSLNALTSCTLPSYRDLSQSKEIGVIGVVKV